MFRRVLGAIFIGLKIPGGPKSSKSMRYANPIERVPGCYCTQRGLLFWEAGARMGVTGHTPPGRISTFHHVAWGITNRI